MPPSGVLSNPKYDICQRVQVIETDGQRTTPIDSYALSLR